jgi:hypothetical protein
MNRRPRLIVVIWIPLFPSLDPDPSLTATLYETSLPSPKATKVGTYPKTPPLCCWVTSTRFPRSRLLPESLDDRRHSIPTCIVQYIISNSSLCHLSCSAPPHDGHFDPCHLGYLILLRSFRTILSGTALSGDEGAYKRYSCNICIGSDNISEPD